MTRTTTFDVNAIRAHFPALRGGAAHFDGPGGSQTPDTVADAIRHAMLSPLANRGTITRAERNAEEIVGQCRRALGDLLNADPDGVVFGRSMTAVTFDPSRTLSATWRSGDEIVVSRLDHDANVRPWIIAADKAGVVVRWADFERRSTTQPTHTARRNHRRLQPDWHDARHQGSRRGGVIPHLTSSCASSLPSSATCVGAAASQRMSRYGAATPTIGGGD
jgi:selenocysteine lyase/cysteine desulfurase